MEYPKDYVPYSAPRWHEPIKAKVIGKVERTKEEEEETKRKFREFLRKEGILKD